MVYEIFPFLESFPFQDYSISSEVGSEKNEYFSDKDELYDFQYKSMDKDITISFYRDDIEFLHNISDTINKLDSLREDIDRGLESDDTLVKFESIKKTKRFLKKVNSPAESGEAFRSVLDGLQEMNEIELSEGIIGKINRLDKDIAEYSFTVNESMAIEAYLNFQLHHVKIMLGVIIASKIH
jgi:hypothetical protein